MYGRWRPVAVILLSILLFAILGAVAGIFWADAVVRGASVPWRAVGAPPEPAARIVLADHHDLIVGTGQGNLYKCCWYGLTVEDLPRPPLPFTIPDNIRIPGPPGTILDRRDVFIRQGGPTYVRYVLLEDGSLWQWTFWAGNVGRTFSFWEYPALGGAVGGFAGFLLGPVALIALWLRRSKRRLKSDSPEVRHA